MHSELISVPGPYNKPRNIRVYTGGEGPELLFFHGAGGLLAQDPFLHALSQHYRVYAPLLPGYEDSQGSDEVRDMLDFTLLGFDVWQALQLHDPIVVGHSMGGMLAAEMAATHSQLVQRLVLLAPAGLWLDTHPVADLFTLLPYELPEMLFANPKKYGHLLSAGGDLNDPDFLTEFMVGNAQRLGTAGKLLFPIPDRGLAQRLYRISAQTRILWGQQDRLIDPLYASAFGQGIVHANVNLIEDAGHMLPYEATEQVIRAIDAFHNTPVS